MKNNFSLLKKLDQFQLNNNEELNNYEEKYFLDDLDNSCDEYDEYDEELVND